MQEENRLWHKCHKLKSSYRLGFSRMFHLLYALRTTWTLNGYFKKNFFSAVTSVMEGSWSQVLM